MCGSYADMHAGRVSEALLDFTGGVHVYFKLKQTSTDLWSLMDRAAKAKALMGCSTFSWGKQFQWLQSDTFITTYELNITNNAEH